MIPQSFDPLMMLGTTKSMGDHAAPGMPGEVDRTLAQKFDSPGSAVNIEFGGGENPLSTGEIQRQPSGVDRFGT